MEIVISVLLVVGLLVLGVPIAYCFLAGAVTAVVLLGLPGGFIGSRAFYCLESPALWAVPFFLVAGDLMGEGGISRRIVDFVNIFIGKITGGLGLVAITACTLFGAVTGSSIATIAAIGSIMVPRMEEKGYDRRYSTALICACGFLGMLIPPSLPLIIFGWLTGASIRALFISTIVPGLILSTGYAIVNYFTCRKWIRSAFQGEKGAGEKPPQLPIGWDIIRKGGAAFPALFLSVVILGGIYSGACTPTEAGAVAAVYVLVLGFVVYRSFRLRPIVGVIVRSATTCAVIFIIVTFVTVMIRVLTMHQVPVVICNMVMAVSDNVYIVWLLINAMLLFLGMFIDMTSLMLMLTPLLVPLVTALGINLVQFGAVMVINLEIGLITPPMAINLFVGCRMANLKIDEVIRPIIPFMLFSALPVLFLTTYIPELSLWLPRLLGYI